MLGTANLSPSTPIIAGQVGTWQLTYTVGEYGLDDSGTVIITGWSLTGSCPRRTGLAIPDTRRP